MFDKQKFEKIIKGKISQEELYSLNDLENFEYDLEYPFEKYYNFEIIKNIIDRCLRKKITVKYLASWANLYNWVLTPEDAKIEENILIAWIQGEISWALDGLSFVERREGDPSVSCFYERLSKLNEVYEFLINRKQRVNDLENFDYRDNVDNTLSIIIDKKDKVYIEFYACLVEDENLQNFEFYNNKINQLKNLGYKKYN